MAYETRGAADERPEVLKATRARQGSWGRHILWVLIISTVLAAIALFASYGFNAPNVDGPGGQTRNVTEPAAFDDAPLDARQNNATPGGPLRQ